MQILLLPKRSRNGGSFIMDKKKRRKISQYVLLAALSALTILYFFDVKFVVMGLNIIAWDVLAGGVWIFVKLCKWAKGKNTGKRTLLAAAITLAGFFAAPILLFGLIIVGRLPCYVQQTEPQTHRTFVAEYEQNMMLRGRVKLYERFGPFLFPCDVEEYVGEFSLERPEDWRIYVSEDGKSIVITYFFLQPVFIVPLEA